MIFVTVGTHEQQFNRLIMEIDHLKGENIIQDDVVIQTGFSTYCPKHCEWDKLISYEKMINNVERARIVITHGGPASFIMPLQIGKIPIVVPRQKQFNEHVNDHQLEFCGEVERRMRNILLVKDIVDLKTVILEYEEMIGDKIFSSNKNNQKFNECFKDIINEMVEQ